MSQVFKCSHSATVEMWLDCGEHGCLPLARVTPKSVVAKESREIPPCSAELVVTVDGERMSSRVMVTRGFSNGRRVARVLPVDDAVPF